MAKPPAYEIAAARIRVTQRLLELHDFVRVELDGAVIGSAPENDSDSCQYIDVAIGNIVTDQDWLSLDRYLLSHPKPHTW